MLIKVVEEALDLAKTYCPIIYQEWENILDFITPVQLGDDEYVMNILPELIKDPVLYYQVREDKLYYYCYYMVYHPFDWADWNPPFLRQFDEHRHDTESVLIRVAKDSSGIDMVTVCHKIFKYEADTTRQVFIEAKGHGVYPFAQTNGLARKEITYRPSCFKFVNLGDMDDIDWETWRRAFGRAKMPDEQYDSLMRGSPSGKLVNKPGDLFNRPERVFESAEMKGRL